MNRTITILLVATPLLALAQGESPSVSSGDYFRDVGLMIGEIRNTQWSTELCGELVPSTKAANDHAYQNWSVRYRGFVEEMESQLSIIQRYWNNLPRKPGTDAPSVEPIKKRIEAQREPLRQNFQSLTQAQLTEVCSTLPKSLETSRYDFEKYRSGRVQSIRRGPR